MDKRNLVLDAMLALLESERGANCSVSDIAAKAGMGKGSIYYYFSSKEEIFDALVSREYGENIKKCEALLKESDGNAIEKFALLFRSYRALAVLPSLDTCLHLPQNAAIHQKSLSEILLSLSPMVADIIRQGVAEKLFFCEMPQETAEIILSVLCFLFDPGIFPTSPEQFEKKEAALVLVLEKSLSAPKGSFSFLNMA